MKEKVFETELGYFEDEKFRGLAVRVLNILPDYFWIMPASTTAKYHPPSSLGDGGLVRHTKTAMKIAEAMFRFVTLGDYNVKQRDIIRVALLVHDGCKCGLNGSKYTAHEHPIIMANILREREDIWGDINVKEIDAIAKGIESHMSSWNTNPKSKVILPLPEKNYQIFIATCDYISAQKFINIDVDGWEAPNRLTAETKILLDKVDNADNTEDFDILVFELIKKLKGES